MMGGRRLRLALWHLRRDLGYDLTYLDVCRRDVTSFGKTAHVLAGWAPLPSPSVSADKGGEVRVGVGQTN
jgi:hypothetical protein